MVWREGQFAGARNRPVQRVSFWLTVHGGRPNLGRMNTANRRAWAWGGAMVAAGWWAGCGGTQEVPLNLGPSVSQQTREILGGSPATAAQLYSTVAVVSPQGEPFCTGTLIAPRVVVTAAHCVVDQDPVTDQVTAERAPQDINVVAGALDAFSATAAQRFTVSSVVRHPSFPGGASSDPQGVSRYEDIAILLLASDVGTLPTAPVLAAGSVNATLPAETLVILAGYGTRSPGGQEGGVLYIAEAPFIRRSAHEFLVGRNGTPDTCPGDSGGPVYARVGNGVALVGVTSRSAADASAACGEGGVYTLVPAYESWLRTASGGLYPSTGGGGSGSSGGSSSGAGGSSGTGGGGGVLGAGGSNKPVKNSDGCVCAGVGGPPAWTVLVGALLGPALLAGPPRRRRTTRR